MGVGIGVDHTLKFLDKVSSGDWQGTVKRAILDADWPRGCKTIFMLNSTEHEIFPADKC